MHIQHNNLLDVSHFDMPIKSALMQDCRISVHNEHSLSLQGQGFFQDLLAEKVHTKLSP